MRTTIICLATVISIAVIGTRSVCLAAGPTTGQDGHATSQAAGLQVKAGQKIVFVGDSVTAAGMAPAGYANLVAAGLKANGVEVRIFGMGGSGATSKNMLGYNVPVALGYKPDWIALSCGLNDVSTGPNGLTLDEFKTTVTAIVEKVQAANVKLVILTPTTNGETLDSPYNQKSLPYIEFLRTIAKEKNCLLADLIAFRKSKVMETPIYGT